MGDITCSNCSKAIDSSNISVCPRCGAVMCDGCAQANSNLCPNCYEPMNYLS